jgi:hypothetical protein
MKKKHIGITHIRKASLRDRLTVNNRWRRKAKNTRARERHRNINIPQQQSSTV